MMTLEGFRAEIEDVTQDNVENGLEALENRIEESHNDLNKKLGNVEKKFGEQLKNLTLNEVGKNEEFDFDTCVQAVQDELLLEQNKAIALEQNQTALSRPLGDSREGNYRKINGGCFYFVKLQNTNMIIKMK